MSTRQTPGAPSKGSWVDEGLRTLGRAAELAAASGAKLRISVLYCDDPIETLMLRAWVGDGVGSYVPLPILALDEAAPAEVPGASVILFRILRAIPLGHLVFRAILRIVPSWGSSRARLVIAMEERATAIIRVAGAGLEVLPPDAKGLRARIQRVKAETGGG